MMSLLRFFFKVFFFFFVLFYFLIENSQIDSFRFVLFFCFVFVFFFFFRYSFTLFVSMENSFKIYKQKEAFLSVSICRSFVIYHRIKKCRLLIYAHNSQNRVEKNCLQKTEKKECKIIDINHNIAHVNYTCT